MATTVQPNELISVRGALSRVMRMRFRLSAMLWLYAILASALATFNSIEEYACALAFLWIWLTIIEKVAAKSRLSFTSLELSACLMIFISLSALCYPTASRYLVEDHVDLCRKKMEHVAQALMEYKSQHGVLPTAQVRTDDNSFDSWRALILPYLAAHEDQKKHSLDSGKLPYRTVGNYFSGSQFGSSAIYFAVTGAETAWNTLQSKNGKMSDNPAETIMLLEELDRGFDWRESRDLNFEEAFQLLTQPVGSRYVHLSSGKSGYFEKPNPGRGSEGINIAFADGSVRFANLPLSEELARALLTAHGGETISESDKKPLWGRELDYKKIYSFGAFALLCSLPGIRHPSLWRNQFQLVTTPWLRVRGLLARSLDEFVAEDKHRVFVTKVD